MTTRSLILAALLTLAFLSPAYADDGLKKEMDDICSMTEASMSLSKEDLGSLITRSDALIAKVEALDESDARRKVFLKRMKNTRDFYKFVLEQKENPAPAAAAEGTPAEAPAAEVKGQEAPPPSPDEAAPAAGTEGGAK